MQAPTLFLWGDSDAFAVPEYALALKNLVPGSSVHVMGNAAHHMEEQQPEEFAAVVTAFLDH